MNKMRWVLHLALSLTVSVWLMAGCTPKQVRHPTHNVSFDILKDTSRIQNLLPLVSPEGHSFRIGTVYVDSVEKVLLNGKEILLLYGKLPSGCSHLLKITSQAIGDSLSVAMTSWRPKDRMCTQQLIPFTHLYTPDPAHTDVGELNSCTVNGHPVPLVPKP